jgi:hypothetical protein
LLYTHSECVVRRTCRKRTGERKEEEEEKAFLTLFFVKGKNKRRDLEADAIVKPPMGFV